MIRYTNTISVAYSFKQVLEIIRKAVVTLFIRVSIFRVTQYPWEKSLAVLRPDFHAGPRLWLSLHEYCYSSSAEMLPGLSALIWVELFFTSAINSLSKGTGLRSTDNPSLYIIC